MSNTSRIVRDDITPDLKRLARQLSGPGRRQVLRAMGAEAVAITQQAFKDASVRPMAWPPLKYRREFNNAGKRIAMPLIKTGQLMRGIHISELTDDHVSISPSVPYAAVHQLGSRTAHIPARPFFPFTPDGAVTPLGRQRIEAVARAAIERLLRR
jgi:phage virion morphogenesis protein